MAKSKNSGLMGLGMGALIALGAAFGASLGTVFGDIAIGVALGACAGVLISLIFGSAGPDK